MRFVILLVILSQSALGAENCYRFFKKYQGQTYACEPFTETGFPAVIAGTEVRLYHYANGWTDEATQVELLKAVSEAARDSVNYFSRLGKLPPIYFLYQNEVTDKNWAEAEWQPPSAQQPCLVKLFFNIPNALEAAKQAVAHEIFHCQQAYEVKHVPTTEVANGLQSVGWWLEGTASFFSNLVYPHVNEEWGHAVRYVPGTSLFRQANPYSTTSFFQYLENRGITPAQIIGMLRQQPSASTFAGERTAFSKTPNIDVIWHDYTVNFALQRIRDSGGQPYALPVIPITPPVDVPAQAPEIQLTVPSYTMPYRLTRFEPGSSTELHLPVDSKVKVSYRREGQNDYTELRPGTPVKFDVNCKAPSGEVVEWLTTSTEDSDTPTLTTIALKPGPQKECFCQDTAQPPDPCLVGHWKVNNADVEATFKQKYGARLKEFHATGVEEWFVRSDRTGKLNYQQREIGLTLQWTPVQDKILITKFDGHSDMKILMQKPGEICMRHTQQSGKVISAIDGTATVMTMQEYLNPPAGYPEPHYKYACQGRKLHLWYEVNGTEVMGWHFTK